MDKDIDKYISFIDEMIEFLQNMKQLGTTWGGDGVYYVKDSALAEGFVKMAILACPNDDVATFIEEVVDYYNGAFTTTPNLNAKA